MQRETRQCSCGVGTVKTLRLLQSFGRWLCGQATPVRARDSNTRIRLRSVGSADASLASSAVEDPRLGYSRRRRRPQSEEGGAPVALRAHSGSKGITDHFTLL